ncbi:MAG: hypothetical protein ACP5DX_00115 [Paracoccaceae bacterium]
MALILVKHTAPRDVFEWRMILPEGEALRLLGRSILIAALLIASVAGAETRTKLNASGGWTAYRAEDVAIRFDRKLLRIGTACIAETEIANGALRMVLFAGDQLMTQAVSANWSFRRRMSTMHIDWGNVKAHYGDTEYAGDTVQQWGSANLAAFIAVGLKRLGGSGPILVKDNKERVIAEFPLDGLQPVLNRARDCAKGLKR